MALFLNIESRGLKVAGTEVITAARVLKNVTWDEGAGNTSTITRNALIGGALLVRGTMTPPTGIGLELIYDGTNGAIRAYNRTGSAYRPFQLDGSSLLLNTLTGGTVTVGAALSVGSSLNVATTAAVVGTTGLGGVGATNTRLAFVGSLTAASTEAYAIRFNHSLRIGANNGLIAQVHMNSGTAHAGGFTNTAVAGIALDMSTLTYTTGGGSGSFGNTYGLYLKAATAGATNYAIFVDSGLSYFGGAIYAGGLPTSAGAAGTLWVDGGVVKRA